MSKIFKHTSIKTAPFMPENLGFVETLEAALPEAEAAENVGSNIEEMEREAYEKGFQAGEKAGFELGRQKAEVIFNGLARIVEGLSTFKESLFKPCEKEMVDLTIAISKKVVQRELELKKDSVIDAVRTALAAVIAGGDIVIKINPKDMEVLLQHKNELARYGDGVKGVKLEPDEGVSKGGCLVDTNFGEIDASIDSIMGEIEERLKSAY